MSTQSIVIDNGSGYIKVGFAGSETPRSLFPTIVGTPSSAQLMIGGQNKDFFVGFEAVAKKDLLNIRNPIENGVINNWDDIEKIWHHSFYNELHVVPEEFSVVVTEKPLIQRSHREKLMQVMFETFNVKAFFSSIQAVLSLFSLGKTTGVVFDAGEGVSHTVSIYEGYGLPHAIQRTSISGFDLTENLRKSLSAYNIDHATAQTIKESLCYVALDYTTSLQEKDDPVQFKLPDGRIIKLGTERITCPEALFQPSIIGANCLSVHKCITEAIEKSYSDIKSELISNIVLAGGSTMFPGFPERVKKEIVSAYAQASNSNVIATAGRKNSAWLGGSVIASLEAFPAMAIDKSEYREEGSQIIHRKCCC